jgi:hypothetical protein
MGVVNKHDKTSEVMSPLEEHYIQTGSTYNQREVKSFTLVLLSKYFLCDFASCTCLDVRLLQTFLKFIVAKAINNTEKPH